MKNFSLLIFLLLCAFNSLYSQNLPFFINLKNNSLGHNYYQTVSFCSNLNEDEIIYTNNIYSPNFPNILDYSSQFIHSKKNGEVIKVIPLDTDSLKSISSYGMKIGEQFIIMSFMHSTDSFYLKVRKFDSVLNLQSEIEYPITQFMPSLITRVNLYTETHSCKDEEGNTYLILATDLPENGIMGISFNETGEIIRFKMLENIIQTLGHDGFFYDDLSGNLVTFSEQIKFVYTKEFEFIKKIELWKDNDIFSPYDTSSGLFTSYLNVNNETVRFGITNFRFSDFDQDTFSSQRGRALSFIDHNGSIKGKVHFTELPISTESDGTPRLSGGLFYKDGYYYTIFEYSSTGFPFPGGNILNVTKFDVDFNIVSETSFIFDPRFRLFTVWAELTEDNSFIGSGFYFNVAPDNPDPFDNAGGFIYGLKADGTPPLLSNSNPTIKAIFTVKGNPTNDLLVIETEENKSQQYEVRILDITGKLVKTSSNWNQGRVEISLLNEQPGVYFYNIIEDGKLLTGGKFVKI